MSAPPPRRVLERVRREWRPRLRASELETLFVLWCDGRARGTLALERRARRLMRWGLVRYPVACPGRRLVLDGECTCGDDPRAAGRFLCDVHGDAPTSRPATTAEHVADPFCVCGHLELTVDGARVALALFPQHAPGPPRAHTKG